jgi:hypothetical protein
MPLVECVTLLGSDVTAELKYENVKKEFLHKHLPKAAYRKMILTNSALDLLGKEPLYSDEELQAEKKKFGYDTEREENIAELKEMGVNVITGVDATKLDSYMKKDSE